MPTAFLRLFIEFMRRFFMFYDIMIYQIRTYVTLKVWLEAGKVTLVVKSLNKGLVWPK